MDSRCARPLIVATLALVLAEARPVQAQVFELINSFAGCPENGCGPAGDAAAPREALLLGLDENFYGTSPIDWRSDEPAPRGWGTVFRVSPRERVPFCTISPVRARADADRRA